jgi:hypothetical protein
MMIIVVVDMGHEASRLWGLRSEQDVSGEGGQGDGDQRFSTLFPLGHDEPTMGHKARILGSRPAKVRVDPGASSTKGARTEYRPPETPKQSMTETHEGGSRTVGS